MRKETTKKFRINIMDILVILLILVCIGSIVFRAIDTKDSFPTKEYVVRFVVEDIKSSSYSCFDGHGGEMVRLANDGTVLGYLGSSFSQGGAVHTYTVEKDDKKETNQANYPMFTTNDLYSHQRCSINGEIVVKGNMGKNGVFVNGEHYLAPNMLVEIQTENIKTFIKIIDVEEK